MLTEPERSKGRRRPGRPSSQEVPEGERRRQIIRVAMDLFARRGYAAVSLRDVAYQVGITKAAIYHHFPSKDALFTAMMCELFLSIDQGIRRTIAEPGTMSDKLRRLAELAFAAIADDYDLDSLMRDAAAHLSASQHHQIQAAHRSVMATMEHLMAEGVAREELRPLEPRLLAHAFWELISAFTGHRGAEAGFVSRPDLATTIVDLFLDGAQRR